MLEMRAVRTVAVLQPSYLPWLGYFDQIDRSDCFVFYDDVQYDKEGWRNRNRIRTHQGVQWLTVPVLTKGRFGELIRDVRINANERWQVRHQRALQQAYARAPYFKEYFPPIEEILMQSWEHLADLDIALVKRVADLLGLKREFVRSSELGVGEGKTDRLVNICRQFGAGRYLTGDAAKLYLEEERFAEAGIALEYQQYPHPRYPQAHGGECVTHLSIVDLLFNAGPESLHILRNGGGERT